MVSAWLQGTEWLFDGVLLRPPGCGGHGRRDSSRHYVCTPQQKWVETSTDWLHDTHEQHTATTRDSNRRACNFTAKVRPTLYSQGRWNRKVETVVAPLQGCSQAYVLTTITLVPHRIIPYSRASLSPHRNQMMQTPTLSQERPRQSSTTSSNITPRRQVKKGGGVCLLALVLVGAEAVTGQVRVWL